MRRDTKTGAPDFDGFARDYLHTYMRTIRGLSTKTIEAYRISLECYLAFLADHEHIDRAEVSFDHFDRGHLKTWLAWLAEDRHYATRTITLRLSAIKAFLAYAAAEDVTLVALSQAARTLKAPRSPRKPIEYLTEDETRAVLGAFTGRTAKSRRNRMLLILLYDTAARVSEITSLTLADLSLTRPGHVTLTGKRNKTRIVQLTDKTIEHLRVYLEEFHPTRRRCSRPGRCSTASTSDDQYASRSILSRPCSNRPPRRPVIPAPPFPATSTATCCARPRPWISTSRASRCPSSCGSSVTRTPPPRPRSTRSPPST
jgi:integrase/recombinase XerD